MAVSQSLLAIVCMLSPTFCPWILFSRSFPRTPSSHCVLDIFIIQSIFKFRPRSTSCVVARRRRLFREDKTQIHKFTARIYLLIYLKAKEKRVQEDNKSIALSFSPIPPPTHQSSQTANSTAHYTKTAAYQTDYHPANTPPRDTPGSTLSSCAYSPNKNKKTS
jgi:hypothetical protein